MARHPRPCPAIIENAGEPGAVWSCIAIDECRMIALGGQLIEEYLISCSRYPMARLPGRWRGGLFRVVFEP